MFGSIEVEDLSYEPGLRALSPQMMSVPSAPHDRVFRFGSCRISVARREIVVEGKARPLQPQPFDLLVYLIENRDRVVRTDELLDRLWPNEFVQPGTVASTVARVRKAIADNSGLEVLRTYHRVGYRFVAPVILD